MRELNGSGDVILPAAATQRRPPSLARMPAARLLPGHQRYFSKRLRCWQRACAATRGIAFGSVNVAHY